MKKRNEYWVIAALILMTAFTACKEEDELEPENLQTTYELNSVTDPDISGEVVFTKLDATSTKLVIKLTGTKVEDTYPAHIHANSVSEGGGIVFSFNPVQGKTGISESTITKLDDGTSISYEGLIAFDGYINVHLSATMMSTLIAQGNIGSNVSQ